MCKLHTRVACVVVQVDMIYLVMANWFSWVLVGEAFSVMIRILLVFPRPEGKYANKENL